MPDGLASSLFRLQVEYDRVRAEHHAAELVMRNGEKLAREQSLSADQRERDKAEDTGRVTAEGALTAHLLILMQMSSLREAKRLFGEYAEREATQRRYMRPARDVAAIAGRVLDVFLNPNCRHCEGRGFNGASHRGEMQVLCRPCRGSGHRRDSIGKDETDRGFAAHLLMQTDALLYQAQRDMTRNFRRIAQAKLMIDAAVRDGYVPASQRYAIR